MSNLADQVAIVTGSGRGIGRAIAHALAKQGGSSSKGLQEACNYSDPFGPHNVIRGAVFTDYNNEHNCSEGSLCKKYKCDIWRKNAI